MTTVDYHALFRSHREHLWGLCYRMTGSAADAEDLVQQTFERAIERPPPDTSRPWRPWLARVATRLAIDALRRRQARRYVGPWLPTALETPTGESCGELASPEADAETRYGLRESVSLAFLRALEALTPAQRAIVLLRDVLGYSGPEAAELLEVSPQNARVLLHRARQALARYDAERQPPGPEVDARHEQALQRFMAALLSGEPERIAACLAHDVVAVSDGGGQVRASTKAVAGRERVARFFAGLVSHGGSPAALELRSINARPTMVAVFVPAHPRDATGACLALDLDADGAIAQIHVINAPDKLRAIRMPG
ncbi:MAG: sigma-70 family RNA polymerase sigma factor [Myxococcales bacterium]|nr:sigma-70 family RNA polymerase sigma factor [Myxococcales bacterium]MCB9718591.1 sigma-70 family RNA polymerase sigma factor [Myxococcales bacterium]